LICTHHTAQELYDRTGSWNKHKLLQRQYKDVKTKHKIQYLQLIDLLVAELDRRFDQPGISNMLERVLTGKAELSIVRT